MVAKQKKTKTLCNPRYFKQKDTYSCGPIALLNALKWSGKSVSFKKEHKKLIKLCKTEVRRTKKNKYYKGTRSTNFDFALRKCFKNIASISQLKNINIENFTNRLKNKPNYSAIILYAYDFCKCGCKKPKYAHYIFVEKIINNHIHIVNGVELKTKDFMGMKKFWNKNMRQVSNSWGDYPKIWILKIF